jgi:hypothetical protein
MKISPAFGAADVQIGAGPRLLPSCFIDMFAERDISHALATRHNAHIELDVLNRRDR